MATFRNIGVEESATVTARVATVQIARGSTNEQQEIMVLGDAESSLGLARILNSTPASTEYGLAVRVVEQPSTVVTVSTGSVRVHQSSAADLNVTVAGYSTTANVSSVGGIVTVRPSDTNWASSAGFHFNSSGELQVVGASASTTVNVSSLGGIVAVRPSDTNWASSAGFHFDSSGGLQISGNITASGSTIVTVSTGSVGLAGVYDSSGALQQVGDSANSAIRVNVVAGAAGGSTIVTVSTGSVRVHQSSAADLNVTVAGYSTTANVSSVGGRVAVMPLSTLWASSAGFHFDSSGGLQISGNITASASTTVNVSSLAGLVTVAATSNANSSAFLPVRLTDGTAYITVASDYTDGSTYSSLTAPGLAFNNSSNNTFRTVGLTTPLPMQVTDSSNAPVKAGDSANNAIRVNVVAGAAGGSTVVTVSTIQGIVSVAATSNANSSAYIPIRLTNGSAFLTPTVDYVVGSTVNSSAQGPIVLVRAGAAAVASTDRLVMPWASTQGAQYMIPVTDSGVSVIDSTNRAINVNVVAGAAGGSTIMTVSTGSVGLAGVYDSSGTLQKVADSVNSAIRVNVVAGAAGGSTVVTVSTGSVRVHQSSAADLNVTVAGYSTTANVSSVGGIVAVRPSDTNWASSAGFHFNSSGELQIAGTFNATTSTTVNVSSVSGIVTVVPSTGGNSSAFIPVRLSNGTAFLVPSQDYTEGSTYTSTSLTGPGLAFNNSSNNTFRVAGLTTPFPIQVTDSSNAAVKPGDSANNAIRVNVVAGAAGGSTVVTVSTGSVRVHQSSAADLNVTVAGYSTTVNVSSLAGAVIVRSSAANALMTAYQSTAADLLVTATIGTNLQSTSAPSSNSSGLTVRQVVDVINTTASTSAFAGSTSLSVQSSVANIRNYVTAYSILTTNAGPTHVAFYTSNTMLWPLVLAAVSSAVTGANLAVGAPAYLFRTGAGEALSLRSNQSTVAGWMVAVSYYQAP